MDPMEERLVSTLHDHADGEVDTVALLHEATVAGRRLRRRRQAGVLASTAAGVVGVLGITSMVGAGLPGGGPGETPVGGTPEPSRSSPLDTPQKGKASEGPRDGWTKLPMAPAAEGEATAVEDPRVVGASGGLLHLSFDEMPRPFRGVDYGVSTGPDDEHEFVTLRAARGSHDDISVRLYNDESLLPDRAESPHKPVRVDDKEALLYSDPAGGLAVRWEPAPGLWSEAVEISKGNTRAKALTEATSLLSVAEVVRVDKVRRCVTPVRLGYSPEGTFFGDCVIRFFDNKDPAANLTLRHDNGATMTLRVPVYPVHEKPNLEVAGHPAYWDPGDPGNDHASLAVYGIHHGQNIVVTLEDGFTRQDAIKVVEGLELAAENLGDPATWPTDPLT